MDFFDQQQDARRATRLLLPAFSLALAVLVFLVNMGSFFLWYLILVLPGSHHGYSAHQEFPTFGQVFANYWTSPVALVVSLIVIAIVVGFSIRRILQLRHSNTAVADLIDARELDPIAANSDEKELLNVVEEMAVAAGTPAPRVFIMRDEKAINAFVAGITPHHILVTTQGTLDALNRDELQGVIGHEFSHLLNGDTRLNLRMMALLGGLTGITHLGRHLLQNGYRRDNSYFTSSRNGAPAIGVILIIAGYAGVFLARLIKAAISRQRETLADASARQFTRTDGLANALIKIENGPGSILMHPHAEEVSHMCFGEAVTQPFKMLMATHPNIQDRLQHINPRWIATARIRKRKQQQQKANADNPPENPVNTGYAQSLVNNLPDALKTAIHAPESASLVMYAMLVGVSQQRYLPAVTDADKHRLPELVEQLEKLGSRTYLPIIDLALPALQRLDPTKRKQLLKNIDWIIKADGEITLFEFLLRQLVRGRLFEKPSTKTHYHRFDQLAGSIQLTLSMLIYQSTNVAADQQQLFQHYAAPMLPPGRLLLGLERCSLKGLSRSLAHIRQLNPILKRTLIDNCADLVLADKLVQVEEAELLRLICALTDSPIPALWKMQHQRHFKSHGTG